MFGKLVSLITNHPSDVQVWFCDPLAITNAQGAILFVGRAKIEFTPSDETDRLIGNAIVVEGLTDGARPQIDVYARTVIDSPYVSLARREGITLTGSDPEGNAVTWHINGAADRLLTEPGAEEAPYDEDTAQILEEELAGSEPQKLDLHSFY